MMNNKHYIFLAVVLTIIGVKIFSSTPTITTRANTGEYRITLVTSPSQPVAGKTLLTVEIDDGEGVAVDNATVVMDINMVTMNMGALTGTATPQGEGMYAMNAGFSMPGPWKIATTVTLEDGQMLNEDFTVDVK